MKLRTVILLILIVFALTPMAAVIGLNLPLVLQKLENLVRSDQLQRMRVEFGDLDQFLASRKEMVRVLAKVPDPDGIQEETGRAAGALAGLSTDGFIEWVNRILRAGQDVYQVVYLDEEGAERLRLMRERFGQPLHLAEPAASDPNVDHFRIGMSMQPDGVYLGPITFAPQPIPSLPYHPMTMRMVSPVVDSQGIHRGVVLVRMDVGGLPNAFPNTLWTLNDGSYLPNPSALDAQRNAFIDFPELQEIFAQGVIALWHGERGDQAVWVPLFSTDDFGPLWVGRRLDPSSIETFRQAFLERVLIITGVLVVSALVLARWTAQGIAAFGDDLKARVGRVLRDEHGVVFSWRGAAELKALGQDLTRLAKTHAKTTADLKSRAKELEEAYRYKSEFLANMSHELRTPLNSVLLLSKILGENDASNLTAEQVRQCRVINSAGKDLLRLIDDILDISKIEAQKAPVHLERVDPRSFWRPLIDLFEPLAAEKGLRLHGFADEDTPASIVTDAEKLRHILRNFLSNAVKFTEQGSIRVRAGRNRSADAQARPLFISVEDTGIGISPEKHELIFNAFQQADGSTSRRFGGTGLGLAISRRTAALLGGRVGLVSDENRGAIFTLYLPLEFDVAWVDADRVTLDEHTLEPVAPAPALAELAPLQTDLPAVSSVEAGAVAALSEPPAALDGKRILLVDDDVRRLLELTPTLERWGLQVTAAGSLQEVREALEAERSFDIALVDVSAPGMDSVDAVREILHRNATPDLAIVVIVPSGFLDDEDYTALGVVGVLRSPLQHAALREAMAGISTPDRRCSAGTCGIN